MILLCELFKININHDYNGNKVCTIGKQKKTNPRLQIKSPEQYGEVMNNLNLTDPKLMDIAVEANIKGLTFEEFAKLSK